MRVAANRLAVCCLDTLAGAVISNVERSSLIGVAGSRRTPWRTSPCGDHRPPPEGPGRLTSSLIRPVV